MHFCLSDRYCYRPLCISTEFLGIAADSEKHFRWVRPTLLQAVEPTFRSTLVSTNLTPAIATDISIRSRFRVCRIVFRLTRLPNHLTAVGVLIALRRLGIRNTSRHHEPDCLATIRFGLPFDLAIEWSDWEGSTPRPDLAVGQDYASALGNRQPLRPD